MARYTIAIVGIGNMGRAILEGLISKGYDAESILGIEPDAKKREEARRVFLIQTRSEIDSEVTEAENILICVKPQVINNLLVGLKNYINKNQLLISIAAGIPLSIYEKTLGSDIPIIRAMPNVAASVQEAMIAYTPNQAVTIEKEKGCTNILSSIGKVIRIEEKLMDGFTAISGSGPAFIALFAEAMVDAGVLTGFSREVSKEIVSQTIYGTSILMNKMKIEPSKLKEMVSSPAGTTINALYRLERGGFRGLVMKAVKKAKERAEELQDEE